MFRKKQLKHTDHGIETLCFLLLERTKQTIRTPTEPTFAKISIDMLRVLKCMIGQPKYVAPFVDMTGKTVVLTGPTRGGIGYEMALELAYRGARLILGARNKERGEDAVNEIVNELQDKHTDIRDRVECHVCDVSDLDSVRTFCNVVQQEDIDVAILNAGAQFSKPATASNGVELTFATCVLGHHLMVHLLTPKRIVWITGDIYIISKGDASPTTEASAYDAYSRACLGRLLVASQWKKRFPDVPVVCVHPGVIASEFAKLGNGLAKSVASKILIDVKQGAQAGVLVACASSEDLHQERQVPYYHNKAGWFNLPTTDPAMDEQKAEALFLECDRLCEIERS